MRAIFSQTIQNIRNFIVAKDFIPIMNPMMNGKQQRTILRETAMADPANEKPSADEKNVLKPDEDKVTYNVSISVPDIISALHQKAIVTAQAKAKDIRIVNSAIEGDGQKAKLNSAGQHIISVLSTQKDGKVKRSDAMAALKEYVHWFAGPDLESKITDKVVFLLEKDKAGGTPAVDDSQPSGQQSSGSSQKALSNGDDKKQLEDKGSVQNALEDKSSEDKKADEDSQKNESLGSPVFVKSFRDFLVENCGLKFLFEENDLVPANDNKPAKKEDTSVAKREEGGALAKKDAGGALVPADGSQKGNDSKKADVADPEALGWYIGYDMKVKGLKESKIKDALKQFAAAWFDGLTIKSSGLWGNSTTITGKDIRKSIHDAVHVDYEKLARDVSDYIQKKYPNTDSVDVKTRDKDTLLKDLADAGAKVDANGKKSIAGSAYSLTIKVKEEDPKKPFFNVKKIAEIIKKCMRLGKKHSVDAASIIKVENYRDDNDAESVSNNATRPSALDIQHIFYHAKDHNSKELSDQKKLSASLALDVFTSISTKFKALQKNKKANQEKENKRAVELFNDFKKEFEKATKADDTAVDYKLFDDFLAKYKKFEAGLGESASLKIFSKRDIASLLLESLFNDIPASEMFEADEEGMNLRKSTEEDKEGAIDAEFTEVSSDDSKGAEKKKDDSKKDVKREEAEPDFKELNSFLKNFAQKQLKVPSAAAVETKSDLIADFKMSYNNDIGKIESMQRKYAAVIDMTDKSSLRESLQSLLINMLFEANDDNKRKHDDDNVVDAEFTMKDDTSSNASSDDKNAAQNSQDNDKDFKTIHHVFNEFKKKFGIKNEEADDIIVLTQEVEESYASLTGDMLLEADDDKRDEEKDDKELTKKLNDIKELTKAFAIKFAQSKIANKLKQKQVDCRSYAGTAEDVKKELAADNGVDMSKHEDALSKHKYATAFVVLKDKKDGDKVIHGSTGNDLFNDAAAKSIFKDVLKDIKFDLVSFEGAATEREFNSKNAKGIIPDAKVFIASFDIDDDKKKKEDSDKKGKKDKEKQPEEKKPAKAYVLPFDFYKDVEEKKEDKDNNDGESGSGEEFSSGDAGESQTAEKAEGADLYIFPIKSSKMFEETPDNDSK